MNATARPACAPVRASSAVLPRRGPVARRLVLARSSDRGPGFTTGFVIGGILFGAIGVIFAPQISKAILGDDDRLRLPRFLDDENNRDLEVTRESLTSKISQLNAAIDDVSSQLRASQKAAEDMRQSQA